MTCAIFSTRVADFVFFQGLLAVVTQRNLLAVIVPQNKLHMK